MKLIRCDVCNAELAEGRAISIRGTEGDVCGWGCLASFATAKANQQTWDTSAVLVNGRPPATAMTQRKLPIVLYLATYGGCIVVAASALSDGDARKAIAWCVLAALWATAAFFLSRDPQPKKPPAP